VLFVMLTALDYRWLGGWPSVGRIVAGTTRQGFDLQLEVSTSIPIVNLLPPPRTFRIC
jgi:hypothetical protein